MAWSPVEMRLNLDRLFMNALMARAQVDRLSNRTSNRPPTTSGSLKAFAMNPGAFSGSRVSAWRNRRVSDRDSLAPAFICPARPDGETKRRIVPRCPCWGSAMIERTRLCVWSLLPPSTTTMSSKPRLAVWRRVSAIEVSSLSVGIITEIATVTGGHSGFLGSRKIKNMTKTTVNQKRTCLCQNRTSS